MQSNVNIRKLTKQKWFEHVCLAEKHFNLVAFFIDCMDVDKNCEYWKRRGNCRTEKRFPERCPLTCNPNCGGSSKGILGRNVTNKINRTVFKYF